MCFTVKFPYYFPPAEYFLDIINCKYLLVADNFQYIKRSPINRTVLNQRHTLTIPVIHEGKFVKINEKKITYAENWQNKHLKSIYHSYHDSTYFEDYFYIFEDIIKKNHKFLFGLVYDSLIKLMQCFHINPEIICISNLKFKKNLNLDLIQFAEERKLTHFNTIDLYMENFFNSLQHSEKKPEIRYIKKKNSDLYLKNSLDLLFNFGPEASFKLRECLIT